MRVKGEDMPQRREMNGEQQQPLKIGIRKAAGHGTLAGRACRGSTASRSRAGEGGTNGDDNGETPRLRSG